MRVIGGFGRCFLDFISYNSLRSFFLGILKVNEVLPEVLIHDKFLGLEWLTHIFIVLTLIKAAYIVNIFMHLGFERKSLQWTILLQHLY